MYSKYALLASIRTTTGNINCHITLKDSVLLCFKEYFILVKVQGIFKKNYEIVGL